MEELLPNLPTGRPNAANAVGRRVSVTISDKDNAPSLDGLVVAFDPNANTHTIKFDDGSTKSLILNCTKFTWIVEAGEASASALLKDGRLARRHMAINRDAVGRTLKIFHKGRDKWFHGTIVGFSEQSGKHKIKFESLKKDSECNLSKKKFRWTDLIGPRSASAPHALSSSRYMGVQRSGNENRWLAFTVFGQSYIGTFKSEKDAALSHDVYARKEGRPVNFKTEKISEAEMKVLIKTTKEDSSAGIPVWGKSKFRGVHWQKNRKRWMARYTLSQKGEKNINLGAFVDAKHAALAFDAEARRRGRKDAQLNFPDLLPSDAEIEAWKMNGTHYSMMSSGRKKLSQYRGVTVNTSGAFHVQININKVVAGLGKKKGPASIGFFTHEKEAALVFDRLCRKYGVPEKELNFPRDGQLKEVRLFDDECYFCCQKSPADPVATPCNHIFCRPCVSMWLTGRKKCPCCQTPVTSEEVLRPVDLVPWPKAKKSQKAAEHRDGNDECGSDDSEKGNESTNSRLGESEDDEVQTADEDSAEGDDDEEVHASDEDSEHIDGRNDESRVAALRSRESEVGLFASSACAKAVNTKRKASCALQHVEGKWRKADTRNDTDRVLKERRPAKDRRKASRVKDAGSEMDEVAITEIPTSSVRTKTLETKRKASCAPTHTGDKRRKAETLNDTNSILDNESRAGKDHGNTSLVKDGSAGPESSMESSGGKLPRFSVGTRFRKEFPGHGMFQGTITSFDGEHYRVYYPSDGDSEELSDYELDDVEMMEITTSRAKASSKKNDR
jgi:hypothetical protein